MRDRPGIKQHIVATVNQRLGRRYMHLEKLIDEMPDEALEDLKRLVNDFSDQLNSERKEGRKDVAFRGRFP